MFNWCILLLLGAYFGDAANVRPVYCDLPAQPGLCKAYMPCWFYNVRTGVCERFIYGGCGGNLNRFRNEVACKVTCRRPCSPFVCTLHCKNGFKKDTNGCRICSCRRPPRRPSYCFLPAMPSRCKAYVPSWFYNSRTATCDRFIYGGCGGNRNRFSSRSDCERTCLARKNRCRPFKCPLSCKYGFKRDQDECHICACRVPLYGILRCPIVPGRGVCADLCNNCSRREMFCCHNGCGHECMKPVSVYGGFPHAKGAIRQ